MANNDHAEVKGTIAGQSFAFSTKDLIPVLLLLCGLAGGYVIWLQVDKRLDLMQSHHIRLFDLLVEQEKHANERLDLMRRLLSVHEWNQDLPREQRVPLEFDPGALPKPLTRPMPSLKETP